MKLKSVQRGSLVDVVMEKLRESIEHSGLSSGDRLPPEPKLIAQLGVSRTVLREAINRLQCIGMVAVKRGIGTYVADSNDLSNCVRLVRSAMAISSAELIRFIELREAIEVYAARQAADLATEQDVAELQSLCERMDATDQEYHAAMKLDLQLHLRIVRITGNELMLHVLEILQEFIYEGMLRTTPKPWQSLVSHRYHMAIVDALRAHDPDAAEAAVRDHMNLLVRRLQEHEKPAQANPPQEN